MNRADSIAWAGAAPTGTTTRHGGRRVPIELLLVVIALGGGLLGAVAHPLLGPGLAIALAVLLMARHMGAEVRALDAWDGK